MQKARSHSDKVGAPTACKHTVSGTISLPCSGCFSPFPHGTSSLSVSQEYLALPDGAGRFPQDFSGPVVLRCLLLDKILRVQDYHPLWCSFPNYFHFNFIVILQILQPPGCLNNRDLGCSLFARHYLGNHYCFLFLRVLRCFSSPGCPPPVGG